MTEPRRDGGNGRVREEDYTPTLHPLALRGVHLGFRVVQEGAWDLGEQEVTSLTWRGGSSWEATLADGRVVNVRELEVVEECPRIALWR